MSPAPLHKSPISLQGGVTLLVYAKTSTHTLTHTHTHTHTHTRTHTQDFYNLLLESLKNLWDINDRETLFGAKEFMVAFAQVRVCCTVLQCVVLRCSVVQHGVVWCNVVQHCHMTMRLCLAPKTSWWRVPSIVCVVLYCSVICI